MWNSRGKDQALELSAFCTVVVLSNVVLVAPIYKVAWAPPPAARVAAIDGTAFPLVRSGTCALCHRHSTSLPVLL